MPVNVISSNTVKTELDEVLYTNFDYADMPGIIHAENPIVFKQDSTQLESVNSEEYMGPGNFDTHDAEEERIIATLRVGNEKTHSVLNYKKTLRWPQEFMEDDKFDVIKQSVAAVGMRGRTTRDKKAIFVYMDGFSSTTTSDAVALWSNSHIALNGDTVDNLETGALSVANLKIMFRKLQVQPAQDGELGSHQPVALVLGPTLFPSALEITKSELIADKTDNNLNYFSTIYPGLQVLQSPYHDSTYFSAAGYYADTAYYLISKNHSIKRWTRLEMDTETVGPSTDTRDRWMYKARFREVVSPVSWEGAIGNSGNA